MSEIKTNQVEGVTLSQDAGQVYLVTCPECGQEVQVATLGWNDRKCKCGYVWSVEIVATGRKDDKD
jgi:hypothetical protein